MFLSSFMRLFALATLLLAALARAQVAQPPAAPTGQQPAAATNGGGLRPISITNDVARCTAFVTGNLGCGEIVIAPGATVTRGGFCMPNHAHIRCPTNGGADKIVQCGSRVGNGATKFAVEGFHGEACTLVSRG